MSFDIFFSQEKKNSNNLEQSKMEYNSYNLGGMEYYLHDLNEVNYDPFKHTLF